MNNIIIFLVTDSNGLEQTFVRIIQGDNETCMLKSTYDTLASELSNPSTPQAGE